MLEHPQHIAWLHHKTGRLDERLTRFENQDLADEIHRMQEQVMAPDGDLDEIEDRLDRLVLRQHALHGIMRGWAPCSPHTLTVVISPDTSELIRFAAEELYRYNETRAEKP